MKFEDHTQKNDTLAEIISQYHHRSSKNKQALEQLAAIPSNISRSLFTPGHFTASGFVFDTTFEHMVLIEHPFLKMWLQPGGHIEEGDQSIEAAIRREIFEETGLGQLSMLRDQNQRPLVHFDIHEIPENPKKNEPAHLHFDIRCAFTTQATELPANREISAAAFIRIDQLSHINTDESVRKSVAYYLKNKQLHLSLE